MFVSAKTLDDVMRPVLQRLLRTKNRVNASRGLTTEVAGVLLKISNARARLSRSVTKGTVFSCIGELLWYLSKGNKLDYISYYLSQYAKESEDGKTVPGGYGPRLFSMRGQNQVANVIETLKKNSSSRRAVIQLFNAEDIATRKTEIPCTCTLQFLVRKSKVHLYTTMRSNDAFKGLPHDVFAFTMLQEIFARSLGYEVGTYMHAVGSLHLYESDFQRAQRYLAEGWQATIAMPAMPIGDPWKEVSILLRHERRLRAGEELSTEALKRPGYWGDFLRLLTIFAHVKKKERSKIPKLKRLMTSKVFNTYIERKEAVPAEVATLRQLDMPFETKSESNSN